MRLFLSAWLPLAVIRAYWRAVPVRVRDILGDPDCGGTSVLAYHAVTAGGGWLAFWYYALPRPSAHGGFWDPAHYKSG